MGILQALQSKLSSLNRLGVSEPRPTPLGELLGMPVTEAQAELDQHFIKMRQASTQPTYRGCYLACSDNQTAYYAPSELSLQRHPNQQQANDVGRGADGSWFLLHGGPLNWYNPTPEVCKDEAAIEYCKLNYPTTPIICEPVSAQQFADEVCGKFSGRERTDYIVPCQSGACSGVAYKTPPTTLPPPTNATQSTEPGTAPTTVNLPTNIANATDQVTAPDGNSPGRALDVGSLMIGFSAVGVTVAAGMVISALACKAYRHWYPKTQMHTFNTNRPAPSILHIPASSLLSVSDLGAGESDIELKEEVPPPDYDTLFAVKQEMAQYQAVTDV